MLFTLLRISFRILLLVSLSYIGLAYEKSAISQLYALSDSKTSENHYSPDEFLTHSIPLSPAFNLVPLSLGTTLEALLNKKLEPSLYSEKKRTRVEEKLEKLLAERKSGQLTTLKQRGENALNLGVLHIYASNYTKSATEFSQLYNISEKSEYLLYRALNSAVLETGRGRIELGKYIRVARLQGDGTLWYNLARMTLTVLNNEHVHEKIQYKALIKWLYDQYAFYTCFLMLKIYEKYVTEENRDSHDWEFIHTMNANLFTHSGNPPNAIEYLEQVDQKHQNLSPALLNKLFILYYKTTDYTKSAATLKRIPSSYKKKSSHYYYKALMHLRLKEFELFDKTYLQIQALTDDRNSEKFISKLKELKKTKEVISLFEKKTLSYLTP